MSETLNIMLEDLNNSKAEAIDADLQLNLLASEISVGEC